MIWPDNEDTQPNSAKVIAMRRLCLLLIIFLLCTLTPAAAQNTDGYPLPDTLQVISPDNVSQLGQWASIGGDLPGDLAWSPDGKTLAVGTTGGVRVFDSSNWDTPPRQFPGWKDVQFNAAGNLISDGKVIDPNNGDILSDDSAHQTPSGKTEIAYGQVGSHAAVILTDVATYKQTLLDTGLSGTIQYVVFSPDEQFAALKMSAHTDANDGLVPAAQLWNAKTGTLIDNLELEQSYDDAIDTFGFHAGGKLLVMSSYSYGEDGSTITVQIWDGRTAKKLSHPHTGDIPVVFSPDDQLTAFATWEGISLWSDHEMGLLKGEYMTPVFSPNGRLIAGVNRASSIINVWNINNALKLGSPDKVLTGKIIDRVTISPDGKWLAANEYDNQVRVWKLETAESQVVISNITGELQFSPNSQWILAQRTDTSHFALWDAHTGERLMDFEENFAINPDWTFAAQQYNVTIVQILALPSGEPTRLLQVLDNYLGKIGRFDAASGHVLFGGQAFNTPTGDVLFKTYVDSPLPDFAFSSDWRRMLLVEDRESFNQSRQALAYVQEPVTEAVNPPWFAGDFVTPETKVFLTPDGKMLGYLSATNRLEFRDVETGTHIAEWMLPGNVQAMTISHDGKWLVLASSKDYDGYIIFLNLQGDLSQKSPIIRPINHANIGSSLVVSNLTFSPEDNRLALSGYLPFCGDGCFYDYFVKSWDVGLLMSESDLGEQFSTTIADVHAPIFSPDGRWLAVTTGGSTENVLTTGALEFWDTAANKKMVELPVSDGLAAFSPDGRLLAVHQTHQTMLYDATDLQRGVIRILAACPDRDKPVTQVAFSPDGKIMYVVSENRVRLYAVGS
ncbi:MAG: WD40 repeat domain-containing protein [Chloroflexota bacterium]